MDTKAAVDAAKTYVADLYSGEKITDVGLEEVEFDDRSGRWLVTVGLTRIIAANAFVSALGGTPRRSYKLVTIDGATGTPISLKDREFTH